MPDNPIADPHNLLIIPDNGQLYKMERKAEGFAASTTVPYYDKAYRKVMSIARPPKTDPAQESRGPAFAILPTKPDPATSQICCYLVNAANVRATNAWTVDAWNSEPKDEAAAPATNVAVGKAASVDVLLALETGQVVRIQVDRDLDRAELDLSKEGEIYTQLRNGLVAGTAYSVTAGKVLPLINLASLAPQAGG
ncbi:MAG TPA: hypothetical protein VJR89_27685 [Polyangiales bacterium]|nr:hypothetical protein [Polyangiales bacterium]